MKRSLASLREDAPTLEAFARLEATSHRAERSLDGAADDETTLGSRPASFGPDVTLRLAWLAGGHTVRLRGPVQMPSWIGETNGWRQWEVHHDARTIRTRDEAGNAYEVAIIGSRSDAGGKLVPIVTSVRQSRADGTLAAIASYGYDGIVDGWGELDACGARYTFRVTLRRAKTGEPCVNRVRFFDAVGTIREWQTRGDAANTVWWDQLEDPIGENARTIHLVHKDGSDDGDPVDDLPLDALPIVVEG